MTPWEIHGKELANCNCDSGCPCQFMSLPSKGNCEAVGAIRIDRGHYGDVDLSGCVCAMIVKWPGPIHGGDGTMQVIIDESATPGQRDAIEKIVRGEDTKEMATMFWVFSAMSPNKLETLYKPIELEIDMEGRTGRCNIPGVFETDVEPIRNPVTGDVHVARINLPNGFEFRIAEVAKGTTRTSGEIELANNVDTHVHLVELHLSGEGVVEAA